MRQHIYKEYDCGLLKDPQKKKSKFPNQICTPSELDCIREQPIPSCGVACEGVFADVWDW